MAPLVIYKKQCQPIKSGVTLITRQIATDESNEHLASHYAARKSRIWRVVDL